MADQESTGISRPTQPEPHPQHQLTVSTCWWENCQPQYLPDRIERDTDQVPQINLNGPWLERAGFRPGMAITVNIMQDCLLISREKDDIDKRQDELERRLDEEEARLDKEEGKLNSD